jgi:hypothetical protein
MYSHEDVTMVLRRKRCQKCRALITWDEQRKQYGRLLRAGFALWQVKERMPLCYRCTTIKIRDESS